MTAGVSPEARTEHVPNAHLSHHYTGLLHKRALQTVSIERTVLTPMKVSCEYIE
jgi:hypothetical protein